MDATRYFEEMHRAMAAQKTASQLVLTACYQDTAGSDAYLELRRNPADGSFRILYSTMGRSDLNFQLFRKGWQLCHNAAGELTGRFPSSAEGLIAQTDFRAFYRDESFDPDKAAHILDTLRRYAGQDISAPAQQGGSRVTVTSYIQGGARWAYTGTPDSACLPAAAMAGRPTGRARAPGAASLPSGRPPRRPVGDRDRLCQDARTSASISPPPLHLL